LKRFSATRALLMSVALAAIICGSTIARESRADDRTHLVADEVGYDEDFGIYVARGHVEMQRDDKIVMADVLTYNERTKTLTASGNVAILLPSGDTIFGSYADVTEDMNDGLIKDFRALLADESRLAASSATRQGGNKLALQNAVYTPCLPCKEDPSRQPIWQVKADGAVQDDVAETVTYHDATMEMFGVPVFWTPYFQHPAPGVKRASGLLEPKFRIGSGDSGFQIAQPYFWTLGTDKDVTFTPIVRVGGEPDPAAGVGLLEYRQRFRDGAFRIEGSGTVEDRKGDENRDNIQHDEFRGHVAAEGLFEINRDWRWGGNLKVTTDKTYLSQYYLGSPRWIENQLWAEGFFGRSYFEARALGFQTTRREDEREFRARGDRYVDDEAPIVLPAMSYNYLSEPDRIGSYWGLDLGTANIIRQDGREYFRLSAKPTWRLPYTSAWGDIYEIKLSLQSDLYVVNGVDPDSELVNPDDDDAIDDTVGRVFPVGSLKWRYPFVRPGENITQIFQPIAQLVLAPDWGNKGKIPNEDSSDLAWDTTRLFDDDRISGNDRVDEGSRVNYGVQWLGYFNEGGQAEVTIGQSLRFLGDSTDNYNDAGLEDDLSTLVGRLSLQPVDWFAASYDFELDTDNGNMRRHVATASVGGDDLRVDLGYSASDQEEPWNDDEEVYVGFKSEYFENWRLSAGSSYSIEDDDFTLFTSEIEYQDECFGATFSVTYEPDDDDREEFNGDLTAFVQFRFTNLGNIGTGN
jgi:LPS-assembly protein